MNAYWYLAPRKQQSVEAGKGDTVIEQIFNVNQQSFCNCAMTYNGLEDGHALWNTSYRTSVMVLLFRIAVTITLPEKLFVKSDLNNFCVAHLLRLDSS